ncbi:MAG TPA: acyl-CoA dehydrogenase family protein [Nocardioides sp.]|uniref:acyl-CoA dehydrogenase family protein n=1 Tax=Nocardioides sp. TaxID=35761 RepID=UPI002E2F1306|nr:acyl-CoA dehydrogenase family protein [Nocardioides sp.]HEX5090800.1 acyl-CoA dehydrogenase family protein [Nocardioides sp.]
MDFLYDDEQDALRDAVKGLVGKAYGDYENRRRTVAPAEGGSDPGFDEKLWVRMAEMGLLGLPFAEEDGGVGAGPVEIGIVCQELGRVLAPEPYLTSVVLAGGLISACGTAEQRQELLGALSAGESVPAFAHNEPGRGWTPTADQVEASQDGDSWTISGVKEPVAHGARADVLVVSAKLPASDSAERGTGLFVVDGSDADRTGYATYDGTRTARVSFDATAATPLGEPGADLTSSISTVQDITRVMAANQALGAMQFLLPTTCDYLRSRKQFGVPLSSFQTLTFRAADMYVSLQLAHSMVDWATLVVARAANDGGDPAAVADAARRVSLQVSRSGRHIGQEAIQLHGGIAMTMEYSVGMYTAHLTALDHLLGDGGHHLRELAGAVTTYGALDPLG